MPVERDAFIGFLGDIREAKQTLDDANMAHAGIWKRAEPLGIHPQAAKLTARIDAMEARKRGEFLRAFDLYRGWLDWDAQPDLFQDGMMAGEISADTRDAAELVEAPPDDAVVSEYRGPVDPAQVEEVEADFGDDAPAVADEDLATAGHVFAAGRQVGAAGADGADGADNPHPEDTPSHVIWARGHAQGLRDAAAIVEDEPADVAPRHRRRAADVVH